MEILFDNILWANAFQFWQYCLTVEHLPHFISGNEMYGIKSLFNIIENLPQTEANACKASKIKIKFLMRLGYDGSQYFGFQRQGKVDIVRTVEGDITNALGLTIIAAGRTDKVCLNCLF